MNKQLLLNAVFGKPSIGDACGGYVPSDETLEKVLSSLKPREKMVLEIRFSDTAPMTYWRIGQRLPRAEGGIGVSGVRAWQIEHRALRRLRHPTRARVLWPLEERA